MNHPRRIAINGKFLITQTGYKSGVYRVARELVTAMDAVLARGEPRYRDVECTLLAPAVPVDLPLAAIRLHRSGRASTLLKGIPWEQLALPGLSADAVLLNLCNLGPLAKADAFTMIHDAQVYSSPGSYSTAFRLWYRLMLPALGRRNRGILTVSGFSASELARHGVVAPSRVHVVHNGCDHVLRIVPDRGFPQRAGLSAGPYVAALATTQVHKNIGILFDAFRMPALAGTTLALFGNDTREDFERAGHDVPGNVRFLGRVDDGELVGLLQGATALAFPSLTEGFGLPPLEAMRVGCPAIVARAGALPEVCGIDTLQADPHDAEQWALQVGRLRDDAGFAADVRARGIEHARAFTWERAARRVLDVALGQTEA